MVWRARRRRPNSKRSSSIGCAGSSAARRLARRDLRHGLDQRLHRARCGARVRRPGDPRRGSRRTSRRAAAARLFHRTHAFAHREGRDRARRGPPQRRSRPGRRELRDGSLALERDVAEDRARGMRPMCIVATVGTTGPTSTDPVARDRRRLRANTGVGCTSTRPTPGRPRSCLSFAGCWTAATGPTTLVVNPHKWLFVPIDLSVLYARDLEMVRRAFTPCRRLPGDARGRAFATTWTTGCSWGAASVR